MVQCVADDTIIAAAADQDPDSRGMRGAAQAILDQGDVELQLPGVFWLELAGLELNDDVPQLLDVEEQ